VPTGSLGAVNGGREKVIGGEVELLKWYETDNENDKEERVKRTESKGE